MACCAWWGPSGLSSWSLKTSREPLGRFKASASASAFAFSASIKAHLPNRSSLADIRARLPAKPFYFPRGQNLAYLTPINPLWALFDLFPFLHHHPPPPFFPPQKSPNSPPSHSELLTVISHSDNCITQGVNLADRLNVEFHWMLIGV